MRSTLLTLFVLPLYIVAAGCGTQAAQSPEPRELARYLEQNSDAAARGGQAEPAGIDGPTGALS